MSLIDTLWSAFASLRANILRTVLTTLGIIIGVAAVIAMVGVGAGAEQVVEPLGDEILGALHETARPAHGRRRKSDSNPFRRADPNDYVAGGGSANPADQAGAGWSSRIRPSLVTRARWGIRSSDLAPSW